MPREKQTKLCAKKKRMEKVQINRQGKLIIHAIVTLKIFIYQASRLCTQYKRERVRESEMDLYIIIWNSRHGKQKHQNGNKAKKKSFFMCLTQTQKIRQYYKSTCPIRSGTISLTHQISLSLSSFRFPSFSLTQATPICLRLIRCLVMLFLHFIYFAQYLI